MKFAKDGYLTIAFSAAVTVLLAFVSWPCAALAAFLTAFVLWFFRDPDRATPEEDDAFFSPADGKVVEISAAEHPFTGESIRVGIFMNVFSVHVNRAPCTGRVDYLEYIPGKKIAAFASKASEVNERNLVGLSTPHGPVLMVQIAGLLARRIVCRLNRGEVLERGERYGMIKLGSRVDVYLPKEVKLKAELGDRVKAGVSCLGVIEL